PAPPPGQGVRPEGRPPLGHLGRMAPSGPIPEAALLACLLPPRRGLTVPVRSVAPGPCGKPAARPERTAPRSTRPRVPSPAPARPMETKSPPNGFGGLVESERRARGARQPTPASLWYTMRGVSPLVTVSSL